MDESQPAICSSLLAKNRTQLVANAKTPLLPRLGTSVHGFESRMTRAGLPSITRGTSNYLALRWSPPIRLPHVHSIESSPRPMPRATQQITRSCWAPTLERLLLPLRLSSWLRRQPRDLFHLVVSDYISSPCGSEDQTVCFFREPCPQPLHGVSTGQHISSILRVRDNLCTTEYPQRRQCIRWQLKAIAITRHPAMRNTVCRLNCLICGRREEEIGTKLKKCAVCMRAKYCSPQCQRTDWPKHKIICKSLADHQDKASALLKRVPEEGRKQWNAENPDKLRKDMQNWVVENRQNLAQILWPAFDLDNSPAKLETHHLFITLKPAPITSGPKKLSRADRLVVDSSRAMSHKEMMEIIKQHGQFVETPYVETLASLKKRREQGTGEILIVFHCRPIWTFEFLSFRVAPQVV